MKTRYLGLLGNLLSSQVSTFNLTVKNKGDGSIAVSPTISGSGFSIIDLCKGVVLTNLINKNFYKVLPIKDIHPWTGEYQNS